MLTKGKLAALVSEDELLGWLSTRFAITKRFILQLSNLLQQFLSVSGANTPSDLNYFFFTWRGFALIFFATQYELWLQICIASRSHQFLCNLTHTSTETTFHKNIIQLIVVLFLLLSV